MTDNHRDNYYRLAVQVAVVAGLFSLLACGMLVRDYFRRVAKDPLESPQFKQMKLDLAGDPKNELRKEQIRQMDQRLRNEYFNQRSFAVSGAALLLAGLLVTLLAARWAAALRHKFPLPALQTLPADPEIRSHRIARWSVGGLGAALGAVAVLLAATIHTPLARSAAEPATAPSSPAPAATSLPGPAEAGTSVASASTPASPAEKPAAADKDYPSDEEIRKNWPRFRGPGGLGITDEGNIPTTWEAGSGKSILWKTPVPMEGHNSPIVWGDRIFLSGADTKVRKVFCFDAAGGKLLWQTQVPSTPKTPAQAPKISPDTGYAASTMTTDGKRAYAIFANGDLAALDFAGKVVWVESLGLPKNDYGHASSLSMYNNLLLVQFDQGGPRDGLSKIMGLDGATGKTVWSTPRPVPNSWPTPIVVRQGGRDLLIANGDPWAIAYNPADGKEIWRVKCLRQDVGPSPTFADGKLFVVSEFPCLTALKTDGQGDVTKSNVLWSGEDGLPDTCSPLATGEFVLLLSTPGTLTCYDAPTGKKLWEQDFESQFKASPTLVGKLAYLIGDEGKAWVVEPGRKGCKEVGTADLGEKCTASPAFHNQRMYLRGEKHLFAIGTK